MKNHTAQIQVFIEDLIVCPVKGENWTQIQGQIMDKTPLITDKTYTTIYHPNPLQEMILNLDWIPESILNGLSLFKV